MIEIDLDVFYKGEKLTTVKGHHTVKGYVKPYTRKTKTADTEMESEFAALKVYKQAAMQIEDWIKEHPEKSRVVGVVNNYTVDEYDDINKFLRGDEPEDTPVEDINDSIASISEFIRDAPKFDGTVYRGMGFNPEVAKDKAIYDNFMSEVENSDTVTLPAFTSTSCKKEIAMNFGGKGVPKYASRIILEIKSNKGVVLDGAAAFPKEQEVLFDKSSEFKVISVEEVDGVKHIKLEGL